ncbi:MAG TPA: nuclear transport factor 2 family protein [Chthoniobacterales bacterium]|nr:nuclear transport factor 2 family protein [Chthoniobacterales bacterium]
MKTKHLLLFVLVLVVVLPLSAVSQSSPAPAPEAGELTKLLKDFLAGASTNNITVHEHFWADDLIYTSALGRRKGKADIMRELRAEAAVSPTPTPADEGSTVYTAEDIRIQQYGTTAIVAFRLVATTKKADKTEVANYLNTGTFLKRNGKWQAVGWQATKMPAEAEPKK